MKTNNELLILGIKARQKQLRESYYMIVDNKLCDISHDMYMNDLINTIKEYQQLEHQLSQIDPTYNPF